MRKIPEIGTYAIAFLIILVLIFLLPRMMPGDPLTAICGEEVMVEMTPELRTELLHRFALDEPLWSQFFVYLTGIMHGDFGYSYYYNAPVLDIILEAGIDSMLDIARHLVLPLIALTLAQIPGSYLLMRNTMITTLKEPFVRTAKAKGLSEVAVRYKHAGRNAMLPIVTTTGVRVGIIVTGALFIEIIFSYPGVGLLTYNSLFMRDYPILQGVFFIVAVFVILANFVVDLLYTKIDPRIGDDNTEYAH